MSQAIKVSHRIVYGGPNRRSDFPAIEYRWHLADGAPPSPRALLDQIGQRYEGLKVRLSRVMDAGQLDQAGGEGVVMLALRIALELQRAGGHQVAACGTAVDDRNLADEPGWSVAAIGWFEAEEPEVGQQAGELALRLVDAALARTDLAALEDDLRDFIETAPATAMPGDARAVFETAIARGIPVARMDREPYVSPQGPFRLRPHGLLKLGQGHRQQIVDGSFCVSRSEPVYPLVHDREALFGRLDSLGVPLVPGAATDWVQAPAKAQRQAQAIGLPVVLRRQMRGRGQDVLRPLNDAESVYRTAASQLQDGAKILVQPLLRGERVRLLVANGELIASFQLGQDGGRAQWFEIPAVHPMVARMATDVARSLDVGLLTMTLVMDNPTGGFDQRVAAVIDAELAPDFRQLLPPGDGRLRRAAQGLVDWLYPDPLASRIPVVAVTGTNGKTTTCRFLHAMFQSADAPSAMACSDGLWLGDECVVEDELGYLDGHLQVLDAPSVRSAVLESTRGSVVSAGLGFARCDVAVCTNVSPDHFSGQEGWSAVEQIAALKQTIIERADRAVVLNADDPYTLAMREAASAPRLGLVSITQSIDQLRQAFGSEPALAGLIDQNGQRWLALDDDGRRPLMAVDDLPLSYDGQADFNLSNALHAALAAAMAGLPDADIVAGLKAIKPGMNTVPGRLTPIEGLPFELFIDYAHNPAGIEALKAFAARRPVSGRRLLCFSCANHNTDALIRATGAAAAGGFDRYWCKNFQLMYERQPQESPALLAEGLRQAGVPEDQIAQVPDELEAVAQALREAQPDDLLIIVAGKMREGIIKRVAQFQKEVA